MQKIILTILFFFSCASIAFADQEAGPFPYTAETLDKKYIFVSVCPEVERCWLRERYSQSGMYLNDGSREPLWTVDRQNLIFLPNGGKHIVRLGRWARYSATYREEAFSFISEGDVLKTYRTLDLIDFPYLLPHTSSHYRVINSSFDKNAPNDGVMIEFGFNDEYPLNGGVDIDNERQTILIKTLHGDKYLFDLNTGNIISSERPARNTAIWLFVALITGCFVYLLLVSKINLTEFLLKSASCVGGFLLTLFLFLIPIISVWRHQNILFNGSFGDYPTFSDLCFLAISMFPRYLLTSLNLLAPPENSMVHTSFETTLQWLLIFWLPCILLLTFLNKIVISRIAGNNFFWRQKNRQRLDN